MNARQRRKWKRLYEAAFGTHTCYVVSIPVRDSDEGDGIRRCEKCGEYTTGQLCRSCREQEMIDNWEGIANGT